MRYALFILTCVVLSAVVLLVPHQALAAGTLRLIPNKTSYAANEKVSVAVSLDTSDTVNAVQVNLTYPEAVLTFESIDASGSAFSVQAENTGGSGIVKIARGTVTPVTGVAAIATVTFTKNGTASGQIQIGTGTAAVRSSGASAISLTTSPLTIAGSSGSTTGDPLPGPAYPKLRTSGAPSASPVNTSGRPVATNITGVRPTAQASGNPATKPTNNAKRQPTASGAAQQGIAPSFLESIKSFFIRLITFQWGKE